MTNVVCKYIKIIIKLFTFEYYFILIRNEYYYILELNDSQVSKNEKRFANVPLSFGSSSELRRESSNGTKRLCKEGAIEISDNDDEDEANAKKSQSK